jgi:hypothetical protein
VQKQASQRALRCACVDLLHRHARHLSSTASHSTHTALAPTTIVRRLLPGGLGALLLKDWSLAPGVRFASAGRAASLALAGSTAAGGAAAAGSGGDVAVAAGAAGSEGASASSSGGSGLRYAVTLRKQPQVVLRRGVWDSWLEGKCDVELGGGGEGQRLGLRAGLKLKVLRLNVTDKQDMQLAVGCDYITQHHSSAVLLSSDLQQQLHDGGIDSGGSGLARGVLVSDWLWGVGLLLVGAVRQLPASLDTRGTSHHAAHCHARRRPTCACQRTAGRCGCQRAAWPSPTTCDKGLRAPAGKVNAGCRCLIQCLNLTVLCDVCRPPQLLRCGHAMFLPPQ